MSAPAPEDARTVGAAMAAAVARLAPVFGRPTAVRDARSLAAAGFDLTPAEVFARPETAIRPAQAARFAEAVAARAARMPLARVLGLRDFRGLAFALSPETLDPRPDSEATVDAVLESVADRAAPLRVLDLGTGTGCLLAAVLAELPQAVGLGIDLAPGAVAVATANLVANGFGSRARVAVGDFGRTESWHDGRPFDLVLSNPPYVRTGDIPTLAPEVRDHDPARALDGGEDGLDALRALAGTLPTLMAEDATAAVEIGADQGAQAVSLFADAGLHPVRVARDGGDRPRAVVLRRNNLAL